MNKIASFTVNHLDLLTGVYVSRKDYIGDVCLTTFDLRLQDLMKSHLWILRGFIQLNILLLHF